MYMRVRVQHCAQRVCELALETGIGFSVPESMVPESARYSGAELYLSLCAAGESVPQDQPILVLNYLLAQSPASH